MADQVSDAKVELVLKAWQTVVEVQQHFNTIEMQIRNIAVAVLTATLGAAAVVYNQAQQTAAEAIAADQPVPSPHCVYIFGVGPLC
jgi:hypothetical protein